MTYIPANRFHSPSAPLRAALSSLSGYDDHTRAAEAIKAPLAKSRTELQEAQATAEQLADMLAIVLLSGTTEAAEEIENSSSNAAQAADAEFAAAAKIKLLEAAEQRIGTELDQIISTGRDKILRHLNTALQDAYRKSRALELRGIHDAEDAISADKADEWAEMIKLRTTVFQIRDAQALIVGRLGSHEAVQQYKSFGLIRNYAELWPSWLEARSGAQWGRENIRAPWPTTAAGDIDPVEFHAWILANADAEPWVPTDAELLAAVKEAIAEARAAAHAAHVGQDA